MHGRGKPGLITMPPAGRARAAPMARLTRFPFLDSNTPSPSAVLEHN